MEIFLFVVCFCNSHFSCVGCVEVGKAWRCVELLRALAQFLLWLWLMCRNGLRESVTKFCASKHTRWSFLLLFVFRHGCLVMSAARRGVASRTRLILGLLAHAHSLSGSAAGATGLSAIAHACRARKFHLFCCLDYVPVWTVEYRQRCVLWPVRCKGRAVP